MTYPPQQPGPYDPQGGGYPQSGGFPQQPGGYPQNPQGGGFQQPGTGGFQQPGGYPPAGGYEQQGGYQQPGAGGFQQPGAYPQGTGGFQQPGMGFPGYPGGLPPQKKSALPWILTGGGVLAVGVVVVLLFAFGAFGGSSGGANTSDPKSVAQAYVTALNNNDSSTQRSLACSLPQVPTGQVPTGDMPTQLPQEKFNLQLDGDPQVSGNTATGKAKGTVNGSTVEYQYTLDNKSGSWCVDLTKLRPLMGSDGSTGGSGDESVGSDSGSMGSGSSEPTDSGTSSSDTNINFGELTVGSCMSGDPDATTLSGYANADCSSSDATMKILAIFPNSTHSEYESDSENPCNNVSNTYFPMWYDDGNGVNGTIYCVGKTGA